MQNRKGIWARPDILVNQQLRKQIRQSLEDCHTNYLNRNTIAFNNNPNVCWHIYQKKWVEPHWFNDGLRRNWIGNNKRALCGAQHCRLGVCGIAFDIIRLNYGKPHVKWYQYHQHTHAHNNTTMLNTIKLKTAAHFNVHTPNTHLNKSHPYTLKYLY